ncbi:hypothetical protein AGABI1DRAFT_116419 [Agaricus bisporus var. burnettii JB137-S8]|uniref:Uncharacterized protein n=1 Tax=Agaricus bisporus var. burnettii (strain JB137-S8 / ATCC MYA-4627 / FGSC 10392) TaxID=597362 RepID=K5WX61_AGABU|nr:uncharacterized protein AGABI1DRAFT_116419 [Agaricus bisporus var. burnettii JB137-S8]EKM75408.1 hypothetical protein AGABI1DRAFT_116419 [Agaricus bisporus var. burnettii JB137-S8]
MASAMLWMASTRGWLLDAEAEIRAIAAELGKPEEGRVRVLGARLADIMEEHVRRNT